MLWERGCQLIQHAATAAAGDDEPEEVTEHKPQEPERQAVLTDEHIVATESAQYRGGKWGQYVRAPDVWFDILEIAGNWLVPLHELAEVRFGFKTGADRFFCVRDVTVEELDRYSNPGEFQRVWGISRKDTEKVRIIRDGNGGLHPVEARFLEPEFHTLMEAKRPIIRAGDVGRLVINAHISRASLRGTYLGRYVTFAEERGWNTGATVASRARVRPWYDLHLRPKDERAVLFWPKSQQYRHIVPWNEDLLPGNDNLYDLWPKNGAERRLLWAALNSTLVALSKHQFGRAAGIEGNLKTEVVDVNMMLVPDVRQAKPEAAARAVEASTQLSQGLSSRYLYEEFGQPDRQKLDDAVLEMIGIDEPAQRADIQRRIYEAIEEQYIATRQRELVAQRDRRQSQRRGTLSPAELAEDIWEEHKETLGLLQFPDDFVRSWAGGEYIDLPAGQVELGIAMMETGRQLRVGTIRVGGATGTVMDVGSLDKGRFLQGLAE